MLTAFPPNNVPHDKHEWRRIGILWKSPSALSTTALSSKASSPRTRRSLGEVGFDADLRLRCAASLRDHYTAEVVAFNFSAYEGRPLSLPTEAAGPKPEYLDRHRREVFGR